jgi:polysaccharide pyruvyl transferase CsaB
MAGRQLDMDEAQSKQILIAGYYGFGNIGDEAILAALLSRLKREFPHVKLTVLSHCPRLTAQLHQTETINRWNPWQLRRALMKSTVFVLGGGGLLQDRTSQRSLAYYLGLIEWAKRYKKPVYLLGQGIGPLRRATSKSRLLSTLAEVELIVVRDSESYKELLSLGLAEKNVLLGQDLALLLEEFATPEIKTRTEESHICVVLQRGLRPTQLTMLADALDQIHAETGISTLAVPFFRTQDLPSCRQLIAAMRAPSKLWHPSEIAWPDLLAVLGGSQVVVGMRLHSLILALSLQVPFLAINYDPKMARFANQVRELSGLCLPIWEQNGWKSAEIHGDLTMILRQKDGMRPRLEAARSMMTRHAEKALGFALGSMNKFVGREES